MAVFLQIILLLSIILIAAKTAGYLAILLRQPSVLGELIVGLLLGPSLLNISHWSFISEQAVEALNEMAEIGVLFLMFVAGLELHFSDLARNMKTSAYAGTLGVIFPLGLGYLFGRLSGFESDHALFLGLTLGATSVSISAQTLMELNYLRSRVGLGLLGAAVIDDVLVILLSSVFLALGTESAGWTSVLWIVFRMFLFLSLSSLFGIYVLPSLVRKIARLPISQGVLSLALVILFLFGFAAEVLGSMAAITGTFLAGLMFSRTPEKEQLERGMRALSYGLFVPVFFVNIGFSINIRNFDASIIWLILGVTFVAVLGKLIGSSLGASLAGLTRLEALQLGSGMISRGEVGLILAAVGIEQGIMTTREFTAVVGMVLVTTLITPPLLRFLFSKRNKAEAASLSL